MQSIFLITAVIGATQFIKQLYAKDTESALIILVAAAIGVGAGLNHLDGITVVNGVIGALSAVGIHTIATKASVNTNG